MSRAQVTTFIVVGLVLLGIVGILFSISDSLKTQSVSTANPDEDRYRYDTAVKIIRDCIQVSTQQSVQLIASQGGALYQSQNGWDSSADSVPITTEGTQTQFVAAGIVRYSDGEPSVPTIESRAPGQIRAPPVDPLIRQDIAKLGGKVVLEKLCDRYGPNNPTNANVSLTCELSSYGYDGKTIQNKLAQSIQQKTISCVNNSDAVLSQIGDIQTYFGAAPQVIFGDDQITVSFSFDTNISVRKSNFSYIQSTISLPVRFKRLYNFVSALLNKDSSDILFDKSTAYQTLTGCNYPGNSACWFSGFSISIVYRAYTDTTTGRSYDLVIARDANSTLLAKPLEFRTIVENRRPVLAPFYDLSSFPQTVDSRLPLDWNMRYDMYAYYTGSLLLKPLAYDYDEDEISYNYSGWKGTADIDYNTGTADNQNGGCTQFDPSLKCEYWNESYFVLPERALAVNQNNWLESGAYISGSQCDSGLHRCASILLRPDGKDIGPHVVRVTATDRAGLSDYADVAVLVGTD